MKRIIILLLALCLLLPAAVAEDDGSARFVGAWQDPAFGRAVLRIMPGEEGGCSAVLTWGSSADSEGVWSMDLAYDAEADAMVYTGGTMALVTYGEDGGVLSDQVRWDDAEGGFTLSDGKLLWSDSREERASEFAFLPMEKRTPEADELKERYFGAVADWAPGTAGSSLKLAALCADVMGLADEYALWDADAPALRESLLDAWSSLDETTKRRFDEGLPEVEALVEAAIGDYAPVAGQFEDAGAWTMPYLVGDEAARLSFRALMEYTHAMGE